MTTEEAISHIRDILAENNSIKPSMVVFELEKEALYMAIKALEQQPDVKAIYDIAFTDGVKAYKNVIELVEKEKQQPCEDCISRKDGAKMEGEDEVSN